MIAESWGVALVVLAAVLVGGTTALLLAPRSGAETRRRITGAVEGSRDVAARLHRPPQGLGRGAERVRGGAEEEQGRGRD